MFVPVARLRDIKPGQTKGVRLRGGHELVVANEGGRYYAFEAYCPHQGWPLKWGLVEAGSITCALHTWRFDLETGHAIEPPAGDCLRIYPVRIEDDVIQVEIDTP